MVQIAFHVSFLWGTPSQFSHFPCFRRVTALVSLDYSSIRRISSCTWVRRSFALALLHCERVTHPKPSRPCATLPTMSLCRRRASASSTALSAFHFLPVLTCTPASLTFSSLLSRSIMTFRAFVTLYSSVSDLRGICSLLPVQYKPRLVKLFGTPSTS